MEEHVTYCRYCGKLISRAAKACFHCGNKSPIPVLDRFHFIFLWKKYIFYALIAIALAVGIYYVQQSGLWQKSMRIWKRDQQNVTVQETMVKGDQAITKALDKASDELSYPRRTLGERP